MIAVALAAAQSFDPPGRLADGDKGYAAERVWLPTLRLPLDDTPAWANSQVVAPGGPGGGDECHPANYSYPWRDTFCEGEDGASPLCPKGRGHTGVDLRPATCARDEHWAVAAAPGTVSYVGPTSLIVTSPDGVVHRYLHLESLKVKVGDSVEAGRRLGRVSAKGSPTTHLHYDARIALEGAGATFIPVYTSLREAYRHQLSDRDRPCASIAPSGRVIDDDETCAILQGDPELWSGVSGRGEGGGFRWTPSRTGAPSNLAGWTLRFEVSGSWRLQAAVDAAFGTSKAVTYTIRHAGRTDTRVVDQAAAVRGWVEVGEFEFDDGDGQSVWLSDATGESDRAVTFDALRVSPVRTTATNTYAPTTAASVPASAPPRSASGGGFRECASGCDSAGAGAPWFALLLALGTRRRR